MEDTKKSFWEEMLLEENPVPPAPPPAPDKPSKETQAYSGQKYSRPGDQSILPPEKDFKIVGYPVYNIRWDDLGISATAQMGYVPNRAMLVEVKDGKWFITGARTSSTMLLFLALGAGGGFYFLRDIITQFISRNNIGEVIGSLIVLVPLLIKFVFRTRTLELHPFELDFIGYDTDSHVLILSTVTEPGGVVAMRVDLPSGEKAREFEEQKLINNLKKARAGLMLFKGDAKQYEVPAIKEWSVWALIWLLIFIFGGWWAINNYFK